MQIKRMESSEISICSLQIPGMKCREVARWSSTSHRGLLQPVGFRPLHRCLNLTPRTLPLPFKPVLLTSWWWLHLGKKRKANQQTRIYFFTLHSQMVNDLAWNQFCRNYQGLVGFSFDLERGCEGFVFHRGFSLQLSANTCGSTGN